MLYQLLSFLDDKHQFERAVARCNSSCPNTKLGKTGNGSLKKS